MITGAGSAGCCGSGVTTLFCAAATTMLKVAVASRSPSDAVIVTVYDFASASAATVPDTVAAIVT